MTNFIEIPAHELKGRQFHFMKFKVRGSRFFIIRHIHNHTSIISSEMQVELKKNTAFTWGKWGEKKLLPDYAPWGVQCENRKNTSATQKHIHDIATGEVNPAQQAAFWSRSHWSGAGQTRLTRPADRSEQRRMVGGGGAMSVMSVMSVGWGRNARASNCIAHPG